MIPYGDLETEERIKKARSRLGYYFDIKLSYNPTLGWEEKLVVYDYPESFLTKEYEKLFRKLIELDD